MVSPPDAPLAPVDTVTVYGGVGPSAVDLDSVRRAAALATGAADDLRAAAVRCLGVSGDLVVPGAGVVEATWRLPVEAVAEAMARARALEAAAQDAARCLVASAERCDLLGWRLLRAAGLYLEAESTAQRVVGALVTAGSFGVGAAFGGLGWAGLAGAGVVGGAAMAGYVAGGVLSGGASWAVTGQLGTTATRGLAPFSDEAFTGLGSGVALARPGLAQGRSGVGGGAGALAHVARELPVLGNDDQGVRITRLGAEDFADGAVPAWSDTGARSVQEALGRIDSLYPEHGGAPAGTVAVQKVTGSDGAVSWTVLIPGTQSAFPAEHPLDGRTDVELVAGQPDGATAAVERALADSSVGPGEPVTFVGHSLGGIAAAALVSRAGFAERYRVGGLVTAGSPTGSLATPTGVPVLHLETPEEIVSHADGRSASENPRTPDRVTVVRSLRDSTSAADRAASGSVVQAHAVTTHVRTLDLAIGLGDPRVTEVTDRIGPRLDGEAVSTTFYRAERAGT
ncbi:hypothetical protein APR04_004757 [Promicromonospora umidemergens]|uniref:Alpha/beta hydrolase family protein n=1 Tax=Promicromonospora umidemergens TaxID=629679 RepID=A0ABP8WNC7_9MICO|nr:lipase family protein [Promicromonospora umidemergens]MCP2285821.1 hypothetical protein [Promicromonospora umidemergens]